MAKWKDQVNQGFNDKLLDIGFEYWPTKNCAEDDALQKATSDGVNLEKAHLFTVGYNYKESKLEPKKSCLNCTAAFGSYIRDRNYSGWSEDMLKKREVFDAAKTNGYRKSLNAHNDRNIPMSERSARHASDIGKIENSFNAINEIE